LLSPVDKDALNEPGRQVLGECLEQVTVVVGVGVRIFGGSQAEDEALLVWRDGRLEQCLALPVLGRVLETAVVLFSGLDSMGMGGLVDVFLEVLKQDCRRFSEEFQGHGA
jgi:hypothetical protein